MSKVNDVWLKKPAEPKLAPVIPITGDRAARWVARGIELEVQAVANAVEGERNNQLNTSSFSIGTMVGAGMVAETFAVEAMTAAGEAAGLDGAEIRKTVASGVSAGIKHPRQWPEDIDQEYVVPPVTVLDPFDSEPPPPTVDEENEFWQARPILSHVHAWARARRVSPWTVLGVLIARVVTAVPKYVSLPAIVGGHASLNTFVGLVGGSGTGKGAASAVAAECVDVGFVKVVKTGSGEGIAHSYMKRNRNGVVEQHTEAVMFSVPEVDTLTALGSRQGATLLPELRSAWSGEQLGFGYADPTKRLLVPAHSYRMCLVVGVQPARAAPLLNDSDAGTPQRFLWLPAGDPGAPDIAGDCPYPFTWTSPDYRFLGPAMNLHGTVAMPICSAARTLIDGTMLARLRGVGEALDGHALLARLKVAAALALLDTRLEVEDEDWELAGVIAAKSSATRASVQVTLADAIRASNRGRAEAEADRAIVVGEKVAESAAKRVARFVRKHLVAAGGSASRAPLRRTLSSRDREHFDEAVELLVAAGDVVVDKAESAGSPTGLVYNYRLQKRGT